LGLFIHEHIDYDVTASVLAKSASRALGAVINKYFKLNGLGYNTYTKLFSSCVQPIMDYGSEVWGLNEFPKLDTVQNRAIRVFLGVHGYAANVAITGDMGWTASRVRRQVAMVRYWNRLVEMPEERLTKQVFLWDYHLRRNNWSHGMRRLYRELEVEHVFNDLLLYSKERAWATLHANHCSKWSTLLQKTPKLRTYCLFKHIYCIEPYVSSRLSRKLRSTLARFRTGILPLEIETGRWRGIPECQRICKLCNTQSVESEMHFLLHCPTYDHLRIDYLENVQQCDNTFDSLNDVEKLKLLMGIQFEAGTARLMADMYKCRQSSLFQNVNVNP
jgi:hypothetical protein